MAKQLLGKEVTAALNAKLQAQVEELKAKGVVPTLGIVRVGERPDDLSYERGATKRAELIGVEVEKFVLPEDVSKEDLLKVIDEINANDKIHGVLMFRPLPKHLKADQDEICNRLDPKKDVDGMTDLSNAGVFMGKNMGYAPCTPAACMEILDHYGIDCTGKKAVIIGRSLSSQKRMGHGIAQNMENDIRNALSTFISQLPLSCGHSLRNRSSSTATCARLAVACGANSVSLMPFISPRPTAHCTELTA